jgi:hypothetical protein
MLFSGLLSLSILAIKAVVVVLPTPPLPETAMTKPFFSNDCVSAICRKEYEDATELTLS